MELEKTDQEIINSAHTAKHAYQWLCKSIPQTNEARDIFNIIMYSVFKAKQFDFSQDDLIPECERSFYSFFQAMKNLYFATQGAYHITNYDHNGNIKISLAYTRANGHRSFVSLEDFERFAKKEAPQKIAAALAEEERIYRMLQEQRKLSLDMHSDDIAIGRQHQLR